MNDVIETIISLLRTTLSTTYKKYYYGEIRVPNQAFLPFIEVIPVWSRITNRGTGWMIDNEYTIQINIKNTLKKYLQQNTNVETLDHVQDLVQKMEDREINWDLKSTTILGILHDNLKLSNKANINWDWQVSYNEIDLGESYITLASVVFTVKVINY